MLDYHTIPPRKDRRGPAPRCVAERFWERVAISDTCWIWQGSLDYHGYGHMTIGSAVDGSRRCVKAHRLSWELHNGSIAENLEVCHSCDTPACVRPNHLFLGTHLENFQDATRKGRVAHGERSGSAKLTAAEVLTIRAEWASGGVEQSDLAARFSVDQGLISKIVNRRIWTRI